LQQLGKARPRSLKVVRSPCVFLCSPFGLGFCLRPQVPGSGRGAVAVEKVVCGNKQIGRLSGSASG